MSRLLVVDDHSVVRHGLVALLSSHPDLEVVGQACDGDTAVRLAAALAPDVAVLDVRMPGMGGVEACQMIQQVSPGTKVVFLTSFPDEEALVGAMLAGAKGYVLKSLDDAHLVEVIRAVIRGESVLDPSLGASVAEGMRRLASGQMRPIPIPAAPPPAHRLNDVETALLRLIAEGRTNREIADALHFTEKTVRNYVSALLAKLSLRNRAEAAAYAVSHNLLEP
ncbi:MAG TPA: response regulator transcription factor [Symbiobacteriaceae bacterium]|nr:response regulator transcription factor [Symbiobacteriaceae bacterium]